MKKSKKPGDKNGLINLIGLIRSSPAARKAISETQTPCLSRPMLGAAENLEGDAEADRIARQCVEREAETATWLEKTAQESPTIRWWARAMERWPLLQVIEEVLEQENPQVKAGNLLEVTRLAKKIIKQRMAAAGDPFPKEA